MTNQPSPRRGRAGLGLLLVPALVLSLGGAALAAQAASAYHSASGAHIHHVARHVKHVAKPHAIHAAITVSPIGGSAVVTNCSYAGLSAALGTNASSITFACNPALSGAQVGGKWVITMPQTSSPAIDVTGGTLSIDGSDGGKNDVAIDGGLTLTAGLPTAGTGVQILRAEDGTTLTLKSLTLQNGYANDGVNTGSTDDGYGGAVETFGNFTGTNLTFLGNRAYFNGGALELSPHSVFATQVTVQQSVSNSTFTGNQADECGCGSEGGSGGAVEAGHGDSYDYSTSNGQTVTISHSTFMNNSTLPGGSGSGGAVLVYSDYTAVTIANSLFTGNTADGAGGAVANFQGGLTITDSQFGLSSTTGNTATTGVGGAVYLDSDFAPTNPNPSISTIIRSSFVGNTAPANEGGAVDNDSGPSTIANSTFFGNSAAGDGGGAIANDDTLTLVADTIAGNSALPTTTDPTNGGGIANFDTLNLQATIIANNLNLFTVVVGSPSVRPAAAPAGTVVNCSNGDATITDLGYNLEYSGVGGTDTCGLTNGSFGDITGVDPKLAAAPADNGGPDIGASGTVTGPLTLALLAGSPAISGVTGTAGASPAVTVCTNLPTATPPGAGDVDGRTLPRHTLTRTPMGCDIGAFDTGDDVTNPITITGALNYLGAGWRLGFAASTRAGYPLGYITFQKGASTLTARMPITVTCPGQCIGVTGVLIPSTSVVLKLTGVASSGRGAYAPGVPVEVDLTLSTSARSATATPSITASVTAVSVYVGTPPVAQTAVPGATAPFNGQSAVHFVLS